MRSLDAGIPFQLVGGSLADDGLPVVVGLPIPQGRAHESSKWTLLEGAEVSRPVQTRVLARWPDDSIQWLSVVFTARPEAVSVKQSLALVPDTESKEISVPSAPSLGVRRRDREVVIDTGAARFQLMEGVDRLFSEVESAGSSWLDATGCRLIARDRGGRSSAARLDGLRIEEEGPIRARISIAGQLSRRTGLRFGGSVCFHAGSALFRLDLTVKNPYRARHAGGYWDLGDPGSVYLRDLAVELATAAPTARRVEWALGPETGRGRTDGDTLEIFQASSGGESWRSRAHLDRWGRVPLVIPGYRLCSREGEQTGRRAEPIVALVWRNRHLAGAIEEFWQRFPSAIEVRGSRLWLRLLPGQAAYPHELQGGEHFTRVLWLSFGIEGSHSSWRALAGVFDPPLAIPDAGWTVDSDAIPWMPHPRAPERPELRQILHEALEGEHSFLAKREVVDEYGWRNYGDFWADHEEAYTDDPLPVISHYNNQYDLLYGLLLQFLLSGDRRWWCLADPLARHVMDIDIYHTDRDRAAYNGGPFWHTAHYHDAATSTHRSMSRQMRGKQQPAPGGGPANEHCYASGLLLYFYLTGHQRARKTVLGLADWVMAIDDGRRHPLGLVSDRPTGGASRTMTADYHGPGRGAGNSINVLLDAWLADGDERYLHEAGRLVRRTIHPQDDLEKRDLGNAELRWSYTVHLQAVARLLELTRHREDLVALRIYGRESLLHYARWMQENERFYLKEPELLEFPTETWAAQELRKGTTMLLAARLCQGVESERFASRGHEILDEAWRSLMSFASRRGTRPVAIVLQQATLERFLSLERTSRSSLGAPIAESEFDEPIAFVDQRQHVTQLLRAPWRLPGAVLRAARVLRWRELLAQLWVVAHSRRWLETRLL